MLKGLARYSDLGLLILRVGLGAMMMFHGIPKLQGGPELWGKLGGAIGHLGIHFATVFWGFMAGATESVGGLLLILGFATRPASILLAFTMLVAATMHLRGGDGLKDAAHPIELGIVFLALILVGPGKFSIDRK